VNLPEGADVDGFLREVLAAGAHVAAVTPRRESLEEYFIRQASAPPRAEAAS
jgi:hypothetical protein